MHLLILMERTQATSSPLYSLHPSLSDRLCLWLAPTLLRSSHNYCYYSIMLEGCMCPSVFMVDTPAIVGYEQLIRIIPSMLLL